MVAALPRIECGGYAFNPPENRTSNFLYRIDNFIMTKKGNIKCTLVTTNWKEQTTDKVKEITFTSSSLPSTHSLAQKMKRIETCRRLSKWGSVISGIVAAYLFAVKKNYNCSAIGAVAAGGFATISWCFNKYGRKTSFEVANTLLSRCQSSETLIYNKADYDGF